MKYNNFTDRVRVAAVTDTVGSRNKHQPEPRPGFRPIPWLETCYLCHKVFYSEKALAGHTRVHGGLKNLCLGSGSSTDYGATLLEGWKAKGKRTKREPVVQGSASASAFIDYSEFNDDEMIVAETLITLLGGCGDQTEKRVSNGIKINEGNKEDKIIHEKKNNNNNDHGLKMKGIMLPIENVNDDDDELNLQKYYCLGSSLSPDNCYGTCSYSNSDNSFSPSPNNCVTNSSSPILGLDLNCLPSTPCSTLDYPNSLPWTLCDEEKAVIKRKQKTDSSDCNKKKSKSGDNAYVDALTEGMLTVKVADDVEMVEVAAQSEKKRWECDICNKIFPTHQALGGHKSSHRKEKAENSSPEEAAFKYKCRICDQSFASGQALGGHQRLHYVPSERVSNSRTGHTDPDMINNDIDLTLRL